MKKVDMIEIIGDCLLIAFGIILVYIFTIIEVFGRYGAEANKFIRWIEVFMGIPIIAIGIKRFIRDLRRRL